MRPANPPSAPTPSELVQCFEESVQRLREFVHRGNPPRLSRPRQPGEILATRCKNGVVWQARISTDRGRLEVVGIVPPSATATTIEVLTEPELRELLGFTDHDDPLSDRSLS